MDREPENCGGDRRKQADAQRPDFTPGLVGQEDLSLLARFREGLADPFQAPVHSCLVRDAIASPADVDEAVFRKRG